MVKNTHCRQRQELCRNNEQILKLFSSPEIHESFKIVYNKKSPIKTSIKTKRINFVNFAQKNFEERMK